MNPEQLSDAMNELPQELLEETQAARSRRRPRWKPLAAAAACLLPELGKRAFVLPNPQASSLFTPYFEGLLAEDGFAPDTVVSVDIAARGLFPDNAQ